MTKKPKQHQGKKTRVRDWTKSGEAKSREACEAELKDLTIKVVEEQRRLLPETESLLESLENSRVFFYPACHHDWNPLLRFTHLCDTFVFCDYNAQDGDFINLERCDRLIRDGIPNGVGLKVVSCSNLHSETVRELAKPPSEQPDDFPRVDGPWGKSIELDRHIGGVARRIRLLYFRAEGVTLYWNLFNKRSIAPRIIRLKRCEGFAANWTTFKRWNGPLGRAVWENRKRPDFINSAYRPPDYNWPWSREWQPGVFVLPNALPAPGGVSQRFREADERTRIRIVPAPYLPKGVPTGAPVVDLSRQGDAHSLADALDRLRTNCAENGWNDVHSIGCHFEDEAPSLYDWKLRPGGPTTLTIHCEWEGDLACYGPAADEVLE